MKSSVLCFMVWVQMVLLAPIKIPLRLSVKELIILLRDILFMIQKNQDR